MIQLSPDWHVSQHAHFSAKSLHQQALVVFLRWAKGAAEPPRRPQIGSDGLRIASIASEILHRDPAASLDLSATTSTGSETSEVGR